MELQELDEIVKNFRAEFEYLKSVHNERQKAQSEFFKKYGLLKIAKRDLPADDLNRYKNLKKAVEELEKQLKRMDVIKKFVDGYYFNVYNSLAYNYYVQELSKRPKLNGKPKHYKIIKDALNEIFNGMPENIKVAFNGIATICAGGRYYYTSDFFHDNILRVPEQIPVKLENPVEFAEKNYKAYEKIADILRKAHGDILAIEQSEIFTPFGESGKMRYTDGYTPADAIKTQVFKTLPPPLYANLYFDKDE